MYFGGYFVASSINPELQFQTHLFATPWRVLSQHTGEMQESRILFEETHCTAFRCDFGPEDSLWKSKQEMLRLGPTELITVSSEWEIQTINSVI